MWHLLIWTCLLLALDVPANGQMMDSDAQEPMYAEENKDFWKLMFNTYYSMKGQKNKTTDAMVESFFEHKFEAYPEELYPAFEKIFVHISKSNDRIWNFYESILYLYHNPAVIDRIYETVFRRLARGKLLKESGELVDDESDDLEHRSGAIFDEEQVLEEQPGFEEQPCGDECGIPPLQVGSFRGIPGVQFPNYDEIPITSFTCAGKHIPGFYADLETGCQVFHVCYPHRRESFLCPIGTIFNQAILACDYWYSSNCSLAPLYFTSGSITEDGHVTEITESFVDHLLEQHETLTGTSHHHDDSHKKSKSPKIKITLPNIDWTLMIKFLPIKSKITECPDFCETTTTAHPIEYTTTPTKYTTSTAHPMEYTTTPTKHHTTSTVTTSTHPVVTPTVATVPPKKDKYKEKPPKKDKYVEKMAKSEILLDILKAVEVLTKDAEGFLSKMLQEKRKHHDISKKKPTVAPRIPIEKPKPFPEINQRFVVKPVKVVQYLPRPTVTRSKLMKPSKQILKSKMHGQLRKKDPAKVVLEGMKAIAHLFD